MPVLLSCALSACASGTADRSDAGASIHAASRPHAPATPEDSSLVRSAEAAFAAWLDRSLLASADTTDAVGDTVPGADASSLVHLACDDGESTFPSPLLADYVVLPSAVRGDTVIARALVTTVGEQDTERRATDRFVARQRVRSDTLEWDVVPSDDGRWSVCNGIRFGYVGADSLTRWVPESASLSTARALADSVRRARRPVTPEPAP